MCPMPNVTRRFFHDVRQQRLYFVSGTADLDLGSNNIVVICPVFFFPLAHLHAHHSLPFSLPQERSAAAPALSTFEHARLKTLVQISGTQGLPVQVCTWLYGGMAGWHSGVCVRWRERMRKHFLFIESRLFALETTRILGDIDSQNISFLDLTFTGSALTFLDPHGVPR